jgi:hypothetical protein
VVAIVAVPAIVIAVMVAVVVPIMITIVVMIPVAVVAVMVVILEPVGWGIPSPAVILSMRSAPVIAVMIGVRPVLSPRCAAHANRQGQRCRECLPLLHLFTSPVCGALI